MDAADLGGLVVRRVSQSNAEADAEALIAFDSVAAGGDEERAASIRRWCRQGLVIVAERIVAEGIVAEGPSGPLGYCVTEYTFFEQGFVTLLMVSPSARRTGVGGLLLDAAAASCETPKLFTSTNVSNLPMQRLLQRAGWEPAGFLHGLDEGDPELFFRCRTRTGTTRP
ncbi:GNAT family N-acetyltransferase [Kitasatospora sp. NPDC056783]|uniref:GNAT family N-acetyltransferase n=1 Tax=Kitasatospora sp. NPDC056783 TaxID=3345943 RepID=UPI0036B9272B